MVLLTFNINLRSESLTTRFVHLLSGIVDTPMDPITAVSLVCNIASLIDLGLKAVKSYRETYKRGYTGNDADTLRLAEVIAQTTVLHKTSGHEDAELCEIGSQVLQTAEELQQHLRGLQTRRGSITTALKVGVASIRNRQTINAAASRLTQYTEALNTVRLAKLWYDSLSSNTFVPYHHNDQHSC